MATRLRQLRADHTNFKKLLGVLEYEVGRFGQGEELDYELLRDALRYMTEYPDRVHHPAEDAIFERLERLDPSQQPAVTQMMVEHERVIAAGSELLKMLEDVLGDAMMPRKALVDAARKYLDGMREHINKEESTLFPRAEKTLKDADWDAVEKDVKVHADPLFGAEVDRRFASLIERLRP